MKTLRLILAGIMLIGNPSVWLGVVFSTSVRWVVPAFIASLIFNAKIAYARNVRTANNEMVDLRKIELSDDPTDNELGELRVFDLHLAPTSAAPIAGENHDLAIAIKQTFADPGDDSCQSLEDFTAKYPKSRWVLAVELNRGLMLYRHGYFSKVLEAYEKAWAAGKSETQKPAVDLADRAVGELMQMNCRVGRLDAAKSLMREVKNLRPANVASLEIGKTSQAIWHMEQKPDRSFLCGPFALQEILKYQKATNANDAIFGTIQSPKTGFSLDKVLELSNQLGMNLQMAKRKPGAAIIVPSVVNWKLGHYAALVEKKDNMIHSMDPTFRNETWLSTKALDEESSGYFLVPAGDLPDGWQTVSAEEGTKVFGKGYQGFDGNPPPCKNIPCSSCSTCTCCGMPRASIDLVSASLMVRDTPLFYTPPVGSAINFSLGYHQLFGDDMPGSNFGTNWSFSWGGSVTYDYYVVESIAYQNGAPVTIYTDVPYNYQCNQPGGGSEEFTPGQNSVFTNALYQASGNFFGGLPTSFTALMRDGSIQTYSKAQIGGSTVTILLTQVTDPQGNSVNIGYDSMGRISTIADAIGQVSNFSYTDSDPYKITQITDPFGQNAVFQYDESGHLQSITDIYGLTSSFTYNCQTALSPDWVGTMTTPYGTTYFDYTNTQPVPGFSLGEIEIADPLGLKEHARFKQYQSVPDSFSTVPSTIQEAPSEAEEVSVLYWDKKAMSDAPMSDSSATETFEGFTGGGAAYLFPRCDQKTIGKSRLDYLSRGTGLYRQYNNAAASQ
jgi:YD repeat-containing protein